VLNFVIIEATDEIASNAMLGAVLADVPPVLAARFCRRTVSLVSAASVPGCRPTRSEAPALWWPNCTGSADAGSRRSTDPPPTPAPIDHASDRCRRCGSWGSAEISADEFFTRQGSYDAARQRGVRHPDIDAVFVACDLIEAGAVQAITAAGVEYHETSALSGSNGSIAASCTNPPLITMRLPVEDMAASATRPLVARNLTPGSGNTPPWT
jgi:hypothetical protein